MLLLIFTSPPHKLLPQPKCSQFGSSENLASNHMLCWCVCLNLLFHLFTQRSKQSHLSRSRNRFSKSPGDGHESICGGGTSRTRQDRWADVFIYNLMFLLDIVTYKCNINAAYCKTLLSTIHVQSCAYEPQTLISYSMIHDNID